MVGAKTKEQAQAVLDRFLPQYNRRFAKPAAEAKPAWRAVDPDRLEQTLYFKYRRVVAKENTVNGRVVQIPKRSPFLPWAHKAVALHVLLDGSLEIFYHNDRIACFDSKTAHRIGLYRTKGNWEVSTYGPETTQFVKPYELPP